MKYERVLITGCGGMLGNAIYPYFKQRCSNLLATDIQIEPDEHPWLSYLDVRDGDAMRRAFTDFKPDLVLHLAALVDVEHCELQPLEAKVTNATAAKIAADLSAEFGATLVYISTGGVFDGTKEGYYTEADKPNPIMVYGATKLEGEVHVRDAGGPHYVIRPGWMVGGGPRNDHKFVYMILDQLAQGERTIYGVTDKFGTPTYTHDFAMNLFALLDRKIYGTYHMVCKGAGTRFDVAKEIVDICGLDVEVKPVDSSFFAERFFAPRPRSEMLFNQALANLNINLMRDWRVALREYIQREYAHVVRKPNQAEAMAKQE
jgi:dTDP-4-dehydrorhamnose reductase